MNVFENGWSSWPWTLDLIQAFYPINIWFHNYIKSCDVMTTTDSVERGMNPVAMAIINPWKGYWTSLGSNQRPPVLNITD